MTSHQIVQLALHSHNGNPSGRFMCFPPSRRMSSIPCTRMVCLPTIQGDVPTDETSTTLSDCQIVVSFLSFQFFEDGGQGSFALKFLAMAQVATPTTIANSPMSIVPMPTNADMLVFELSLFPLQFSHFSPPRSLGFHLAHHEVGSMLPCS